MGVNLKTNKSFCLAPWTHSHISAQGERQLCCISNGNFGVNLSLDEMWNSDEMKDIRKKMLNGEKLEICNRCNEDTSNPYTYRSFFNDKFKHLLNKVLDKTKEDGTVEQYPVSIDYRTNICNFKCKMCYEGCSTQIQTEKIKNGIDISVLSNDERKNSEDIIKNEFNNPEIYKNIVDIYWAGGEPLYWKRHWETLDMLIKTGNAKNITLRYNSNLSIIDYNGVSVIDFFKHFKHVDLSCSLDGTGDIGEWIRSNLNYTIWRENFSKMVREKNEYNNIQLYIAVAVTTPTLFDLENLYKLCLEFNILPGFQTCYVGSSFSLLTPLSFPKEMIRSLVNEFLEKYSADQNPTINLFRDYLNFLVEKEFFDNDPNYLDEFKKGVTHINYLELNRPHLTTTFESILSTNKPLYEFYMKNK